jgi:hypothetical protein
MGGERGRGREGDCPVKQKRGVQGGFGINPDLVLDTMSENTQRRNENLSPPLPLSPSFSR